MSEAGSRSRVVVAAATYQSAGSVIEGIFDQFAIEWSGKKVLVKPNMLAAWPP